MPWYDASDPNQVQQQQQQQQQQMQLTNMILQQQRERERRERIARGEDPDSADCCSCLIVFALLIFGTVAGVLSVVL